MYTLTIPARLYAMLAANVSREETRPVLNGTHVAIREDGTVIATATNGHSLVQGRYTPAIEASLPADGVILTIVKLSSLGITPKALDDSTVSLTSADGEQWTASGIGRYGLTGKMATAQAIEGPYPNVRHVLMREENEKDVGQIALDPEVFANATAHFGKVSIRFHGDSRAIVARPYFPPDNLDVFALIMPLRNDEPARVPTWAFEGEPVGA